MGSGNTQTKTSRKSWLGKKKDRVSFSLDDEPQKPAEIKPDKNHRTSVSLNESAPDISPFTSAASSPFSSNFSSAVSSAATTPYSTITHSVVSPRKCEPDFSSIPSTPTSEQQPSKKPNKKPKEFPTVAAAYKLLECVGKGTEGSVWRAVCIPNKTEVAVKIVDLEGLPHVALEEIKQQTYVMQLCNRHPNIVNYHTSFIHSHYLWVVMSYLSGGSCLDIMKYGFPYGLDEIAIRVILKGVLKALAFFHQHGRIHRDIKAGNILVSDKGHVQVADFGVSACLAEQQSLRTTLCGTPCWMAPEVMMLALPKNRDTPAAHGYNCAVDIWSLGITALELARGRPPFAEFPTSKVFSMIVQNEPPTLATEGKQLPANAMSPNTRKKFTKHFQDFVACCLQKDPTKRPSAAKLLKHKFFSKRTKREHLVSTVLSKLPPLGERFRIHHPAHTIPRPPPTTAEEEEAEKKEAPVEWVFPEENPEQAAFEKAWIEKTQRITWPIQPMYSMSSVGSLFSGSFMSSAASSNSGDSWTHQDVGSVDFLNHIFQSTENF